MLQKEKSQGSATPIPIRSVVADFPKSASSKHVRRSEKLYGFQKITVHFWEGPWKSRKPYKTRVTHPDGANYLYAYIGGTPI